jgi:hypothetical protein
MRKARVLVNGVEAGELEKLKGGKYQFTYYTGYERCTCFSLCLQKRKFMSLTIS